MDWRGFYIKAFTILLVAISFIAMQTGCAPSPGNKIQNYEIGAMLDKEPEIIRLADVAQDIQLIPIETNDSILVEYINAMFEVGDRLIIVHGNRCSVFDKSGKYLHDISRQGQGPNEFVDIWDAFVEDGLIYLYDRNGKKLRAFTPEGAIKEEINVPAPYNSVSKAYKDYFMGYIDNIDGKAKNKWILFDKTGITDSIPTTQQYAWAGMPLMFWKEGYIYSAQGQKYAREIFNDTVFTVTPENRLEPCFILDLGKYKTAPELRYSVKEYKENLFDDFVWLSIAGENENSIYLNMKLNKVDHSFHIDKKSRTVHHVRFLYPEDIPLDDDFIPLFMSNDGKKVISYHLPEESDENPTIIMASFNN